MPEQTIVILGNSAPMEQVRQDDGTTVGRPHPIIQQTETRVEMWPGFDDPENVALTASTDNDRIFSMIHRSLADEHKDYAIGISELEQIWGVHSGNSRPDWVSSNNAAFAQAIGAHFRCPVSDQPPSMLLTTVGRDAIHAQHMSTAAQPASFNYMALTASTTAPAVGDTTLAGEIVTTGLARAQCTYTHTAGTNTSTLTHTFTAVAADVAGGSVVVAQIGVFNAASGGTLGYHTAMVSTATITAAGDNVQNTETVTAG
jgi:hypothetical protein